MASLADRLAMNRLVTVCMRLWEICSVRGTSVRPANTAEPIENVHASLRGDRAADDRVSADSDHSDSGVEQCDNAFSRSTHRLRAVRPRRGEIRDATVAIEIGPKFQSPSRDQTSSQL